MTEIPGSDARAAILQQVRQAVGVPPTRREADWQAIPRFYHQHGLLDSVQRLELFLERLHDYDSATHICSPAEIAPSIGRILQSRSLTRIVIPTDLPLAWLPANFTFVPDEDLHYEAIDATDGVITGCSVAVALTGTIILQEGVPAGGRRALSLIPDYHLCIVRLDQLVETVPEAFRAINSTSTLPITTISGPSATSDIEMIRIRGVHGPRTLEVLIVDNTAP